MNENKIVGLIQKRERKKRLIDLLFCSFVGCLICGVGALVIVDIVKNDKAYKECLKYPPDTNWVEEDLEHIFMTTGVCCLKWEQQENHAYYDVEANGFYYRCHYSISRASFSLPHWRYTNNIQINWTE